MRGRQDCHEKFERTVCVWVFFIVTAFVLVQAFKHIIV
ncbi:unnamed protein product [Haemonchus placei]|uniref:DUF3961 domain-containing protein n=1 Tax=Haemonchus placei TaxID=6290 RepID=A0A0N4WCN7_HAEPC|nr:unnamed protein product [Haemonchus placei]